MQQVTTLWNSAHYMLQRVLEQQQSLRSTLLELRQTDPMLVDAEIAAESNLELDGCGLCSFFLSRGVILY